jgi:hypothetical protein
MMMTTLIAVRSFWITIYATLIARSDEAAVPRHYVDEQIDADGDGDVDKDPHQNDIESNNQEDSDDDVESDASDDVLMRALLEDTDEEDEQEGGGLGKASEMHRLRIWLVSQVHSWIVMVVIFGQFLLAKQKWKIAGSL